MDKPIKKIGWKNPAKNISGFIHPWVDKEPPVSHNEEGGRIFCIEYTGMHILVV